MEADSAEVSELEARVAEDRIDESPNEERTIDDRLEAKEPMQSRESAEKEIGLLERMYSNVRREAKRNSDKREQPADTYDGAVVIVYHIDSEGRVYFSLEQKSGTHPSSGKYALYGGTVRVDENHVAAAERELQEEDPNGSAFIIKALNETHYKVTEVPEYFDGTPSRMTIWAAEIKDASEWENYKLTKTTEGHKTILSLEDTVAAVQKNDFAYPSQGRALLDFAYVLLNSPKFYSTGLPLAHTSTYKPTNLSSIMHSIN